MSRSQRTRGQAFLDFVTFPLRAFTLFYDDRWGLSSLATDRYDYVAQRVRGRCLDIGCGPGNRFITDFLDGNGVGIDVHPYAGLTTDNLVPDPTSLPFADESFDTVTFIANLNHVPRHMRDSELREAFRVLKPGGNIVVTMGNPLAELLVHKVVAFYDRLFRTQLDIDTERGMAEGEEYYLLPNEIVHRLACAGFQDIHRKFFITQFCLNSLFEGWKTCRPDG